MLYAKVCGFNEPFHARVSVYWPLSTRASSEVSVLRCVGSPTDGAERLYDIACRVRHGVEECEQSAVMPC